MVSELRYHNPGQGCIITRAATQAAADKIEALRERVTELEVFTGHLRASRDHAVQANEAAEARVVDSYAAGLEAAISAVKLVEPAVYPGTLRPHIDRLDTIEAIRALGKEEE